MSLHPAYGGITASITDQPYLRNLGWHSECVITRTGDAQGNPLRMFLAEVYPFCGPDISGRYQWSLSLTGPADSSVSAPVIQIADCQSGVWTSPGGDTALKAPIGYTLMPSGVIFMWGIANITSNGSSGVSALQTVVRPVRCPTNPGQVVATQDATGIGTIGGSYSAIVGDLSLTSFSLGLDDNGASTRTLPVRWQATCW